MGQAVTVPYSVTVTSAGAGTPTGNVTVSDGMVSCTGTVAAGQCSLTLTSAGAKTLTAVYAGDPDFAGSTSSTEAHTVNPAATTTAITSDNPDPSFVGHSVTVGYGVAVTSPGAGTPTGNVTVSDGTVSYILGQNPFELATVDDEDPAQTLPPYGADALADRVGPGRPHRGAQAPAAITMPATGPKEVEPDGRRDGRVGAALPT